MHPSSSSLLLHCGCTSIQETDSEKPLTLSYVSHPILCLSPYPISLNLSYRASRTLVHPTDSEKPPDAELRNACDIVHHTPRLSRTLLHKPRYSLPVLHAPYVPQCYTLPTPPSATRSLRPSREAHPELWSARCSEAHEARRARARAKLQSPTANQTRRFVRSAT